MTSVDLLSLEALRSIQQKRLAMSRAPAHISGREAKDLTKSPEYRSTEVQAFAKWFRENQKNRLLVMSSDSILSVQSDLSSTFAVGHLNGRYFIAAPESVSGWIAAMPWLHIAIDPEASSLAFVCLKVTGGGVVLPPFALNFNLPYKGLANLMANYHYLDLRTIAVLTGESGGQKRCQISDDVIGTLCVAVTPGAKSISDFIADDTLLVSST